VFDDPNPGNPRRRGNIRLDLLAPPLVERACPARIYGAAPDFFSGRIIRGAARQVGERKRCSWWGNTRR